MEEWYQSVCLCCMCIATVNPKLFICWICKKAFRYSCSLSCHMKHIHSTHPTVSMHQDRKSRFRCPGENCPFSPTTSAGLRKHVNFFHAKLEDQKNLKFANWKEFEEWREKEEADIGSCFRKGSRDKSTRISLRKYYCCWRSGTARIRKGVLNPQNSFKIGATCPAAINVQILKNGEINVQYFKTHFGHGDTVFHLYKRLNFGDLDPAIEERANSEGFGQVCADHRNAIMSESEIRTLNHLIKKYDNITQTVTLNSEHWDQNDAISVNNWVASSMSSEDNPVVLYKSTGTEMDILRTEDFILVLMDRCQICLLKELGMNGKVCIDLVRDKNACYFSVMTILVSDQFGSSFPVAFCLSNRSDAEVVKLFFSTIKKNVGNIHANVFMSPDDPMYYNEWKSVMEKEVDHVLFCFWDVDESWRIKLENIGRSSPKVKRAEIYRAARVLLEEENKNMFDQLQSYFLNTLLNDDEVKEFGSYFKNEFSERVQSWAYHCRKLILDMNANTQLEATHLVIKHIYFNSKKLKRIDKCILTLLQFIRDIEFDHLVKISDESTAYALRNIYISHKESVNIPETLVAEVEYNQKWLVKSASDSSKCYEVKRDVESCNIENCNLACEVCQVCIHCFSCTCNNYNMCKHIHRVVILFQQSLISSSSIRFMNFRTRFDEMFIQGVICRSSEQGENNLISSKTTHKNNHKSKMSGEIPSKSIFKYKVINTVPSEIARGYKVPDKVLKIIRELKVRDKVPSEIVHEYKVPDKVSSENIHEYKVPDKIPSENVHEYKVPDKVSSENTHEYKVSDNIPSENVHEYKVPDKVSSENTHEYKVSDNIPSESAHQYKISDKVPQKHVNPRNNIISKLQLILSIVMSTRLPPELEADVAKDVNGILSKVKGDVPVDVPKNAKKRKLE